MRERRWIALAAIFLATAPLAAQDDRPTEPYMLQGEDAPLSHVIEEFLSQAACWYAYDDRGPFEGFCREYGIDPTWPSAARLGAAAPLIEEEYLRRMRVLAEQRGVSTDPDPNEWKPAAIGRSFGELYSELRADGLPWDLRQFLRLIESRVRSTFETYSDQPFDDAQLATTTALFWDGIAATSPEAADLAEQRRSQ